MPTDARSRVTGVVLAGGMASRYSGRPKGLELVGGARIIDRVAEALREVTDDLLAIANDPAGASWLPDVRSAGDVRPGMGSLGGIHAAIVRAGGPVIAVAWDMPFISVDLLREMRRVATPDIDVVVPESGSRRGVEPLCAYYTPRCVHAIEERIDAGDLRVVGFYDAVHVARVPFETVRRFGDPELLFLNVNTPDDLALAERHAEEDDPTHGHRRRQKA